MMRVTDSISYRNFLYGSTNLNSQLERASLQVSTGKRLASLGDGPGDSGELVLLRTQLERIDQYRSSAETTRFFLSSADSTLDEAQKLYTTIFTKASEAATETVNAEGRAALADEVRSLRDQILALANTQAQGRYLFAGSRVTTTPFSIAGDTVTYAGAADVNTVSVGGALSVEGNVPGDAAFSAIFTNIEAILGAMDAGDLDAIGTELEQFDAAKDALSAQREKLGTALSAVDDAVAAADRNETSLETRKSGIEDANVAEAVTDLTRIETALRATMSAGARLDGRTLFDYIG